MTHAEEIMRSVGALISQGKNIFSRREVRDQIGINQDRWVSGYTAIFQGMRVDHPGGAPPVAARFRNVFKQIEYGKYALTEYGMHLLKEFLNEGTVREELSAIPSEGNAKPREELTLTPPFEAYKGDQPFVFVSYTHQDKTTVYPIIQYLNREGVRLWYDEGIPPASDWIKSIANTLIKCETFLVFLSPKALESEYVKDEILLARTQKKQILPVYIEETYLPPELQLQLGRFQAIFKYKMQEETFWKKLKSHFKIITEQLEEKYASEEIEDQKPLNDVMIQETPIQLDVIDAKVLAGLEKTLHKSIPQSSAPVEKNVGFLNFGYRRREGKIYDLGLYSCGLKTLPDSIGRLDALEGLNLRYNQLSTLPDSFGNLHNLQYLGLGGNRLISLPESFIQLRSLEYVDLSDNELTTLPVFLLNLEKLRRIKLGAEKLDLQGKSILSKLKERGVRIYKPTSKAENNTLLKELFGSHESEKD